MSERREWKFEFATENLAEAALKKVDYHLNREFFWETELAAAEEKAREAGVNFETYDVTGGKRIQIKIDPSLMDRYDECFNKLEGHKRQKENFERFLRAFELNPGVKLTLDIDDINYFDL